VLSLICVYFILPLAFSLVYICASHLRAGFVPAFCSVRRSSFTCSHLLPPTSHGFPFVFGNSKVASFIKFRITQLVRWFACLSCHIGSTMILSRQLALWIFILVYALVFWWVCSFRTFCVSTISNEPVVFSRLCFLWIVLRFCDFE
jgi:hypothetical protein